MGNSLVRMMAETKVFEQQGQQQGQGGGGGGNPSTANSCYNNNYSSYFQRVYQDTANNYRIYQIWKNNPNGGYQWYSWDSSSAPTSSQITAMKRHLNGLKANGDSRCVLPSNPGFVLLNTSVGQYNGWHTYRDIHESANAGCTDSNSSNYDSTALTLDTSCQFYESSSLGIGYSKNSKTFGDGVRFESNRKFFRKTLPNNQVDSYFVSTIEKVCTSSKCAVNGAREKTVAWTETTPTFTWGSNKASYDSAKAASKTAIDNAMASLEAGYVPNCTMTQQPPITYKKDGACDGTQFGITQTNYTSNCSGSVEKIVYSFSNGESYTWEKSSGITSSAFKNSTPADSRAGYGGLSDRLLTIIDNHNQSLGVKTETRYDKHGEHHQGVVGQPNGQQLFIVIETYPVTEDACGTKTKGEGQFYGYTYVYDDADFSGIRPFYDGINEATGQPIVYYDGVTANSKVIMPPTTVFGPFKEKPSFGDLLGKVVRGCTDPTATNYDEKANTDSTGNIGKCKYEESGGNGDGDANEDVLTEPPLEPSTTFSPLLLIPVALLAVGLIVKSQ